MKKIHFNSWLLAFIIMNALQAQNVGIGTSSPNPSAKLEIESNNSGLLVPRMTTAERNAIPSPAHSLLIYNTTTDCFEAWNANTSQWVSFGCIGCQLPGAFSANAGSGITLTDFTANWGASAGATGYHLDVATDAGFTSFVTGYNNLNVGNVTSYNVTGLTCGTTYYYRLRAYNACGTSANSNTITVTTGSCVPTAPACGSQVFMTVNMNVGTQVPAGTTQNPGEKWCYNDVAANCATYGGLYQWASAMNIASTYNSNLANPTPVPSSAETCDPCGSSGWQGICPAGYHIPTDLEWSRYEWCVENTIPPMGSTPLSTFQTTYGNRGSTTPGVGPGDKMKVTSSNIPPWDGTNASGFSALPAGFCFGSTSAFLGVFLYFWSATEFSATHAWDRSLDTGEARSWRGNFNKPHGFSVRCLQN